MRVLITLAHPAHVHFFKNFVDEMRDLGHEFKLMVKKRENTTRLLDLLGYDYEVFGKTYSGTPSKAWGVVRNDLSLVRSAKKFDPDFTASIGGLYSCHAGAMRGVPTIDFMDTESATFTNYLTFPFATVVATPDCYRQDVPSKKHLTYKGYHELAYLHPDRFDPKKKYVEEAGLEPGEYSVVRFSSQDARHQEDEVRLQRKEKIDLVRNLSDYGPVLVDSEEPLPGPIQEHRMDIREDRFHHILAHASLYVGQGATTASEAGVLGVPWIFISNSHRCYLEDQEVHYHLGVKVESEKRARDMVEVILEGQWDFEGARKRLLEDKIDVTEWMVRLAEFYK